MRMIEHMYLWAWNTFYGASSCEAIILTLMNKKLKASGRANVKARVGMEEAIKIKICYAISKL